MVRFQGKRNQRRWEGAEESIHEKVIERNKLFERVRFSKNKQNKTKNAIDTEKIPHEYKRKWDKN